MIAAAVLLSLAAAVSYVFGWQYDQIEQPATHALAFAIPAGIASIILLIRDRDAFSPLHLILYVTILSITFKTLYLLHLDPDGESVFLSTGRRNTELLFGGLWLVAVGLAALIFGYLLTFPRQVRNSRMVKVGVAQRRVLIPIFCLVVLLALFAIYQFLAQTNSFSQILQGQIFVKRFSYGEGGRQLATAQIYLRFLGQTLPQAGLLLLLSLFWTRPDLRRRRDLVLLGLLAFAACAIPLLASSRLVLAYLGLSVVMLYHYLVKPLTLLRMATFGFVAFTILGVLGELRKSQQSEYKFEADYSAAKFVSTTLGRPYFLDVGKTAAVYDAVPDRIDFINGSSLANIIYAPIPRAIWPEKPVLAINIFVRDKIIERDDQSGVPPGGIAELYLNFGFPAVIIGMMFIGVLTGVNYRGLQKRAGSDMFVAVNVMMTVVLIFTFLTVEIITVVSQSAQIFFSVLPVWLALQLTTAGKRVGFAGEGSI